MRRLVAFALTTPLLVSHAAADGETTPMFGAGVVAGSSTTDDSRMFGIGLDAAWWWGWLGIALEASGRSSAEGDDTETLVLGGSLRLRVLQALVPSLLEPSDVELGIELQGILERTWWERTVTDVGPIQQGVGVALRLRGSTDDDMPRLITESRCFLRLMWRRDDTNVSAARTTMSPVGDVRDARELMVLVGIGAAFGGGERRYLEQFRRRASEGAVLRQLNEVAPD